MPDEWFIQVEGKEYGPADLTTLREWKAEGRVLPTNDVRRADSSTWQKAETIDGLFEAPPPPPPPIQKIATPQFRTEVSTRNILPETFRIFTRGFFKYLGLTLLLLGPSLCAQITSSFIQSGPATKPDTGTLLVVAFDVCMFVLMLVLIPIYIAGLQILTAAHAAGERISFFAVLNEAVKFWPRVAVLCMFVWLCYFCCAFVPFVLIVPILVRMAMAGPSMTAIFLVLALTGVMVWAIGRLWINFMFWQQFAVLEGCNALDALRRSRDLARSQSDLPWFRRPLWRGVFIATLWFALVLVLYWPLVSQSFQTMTDSSIWSISDPQKLAETITGRMKNSSEAGSTLAAGILKSILKPLLGIAFVLLFLDCNLPASDK
jgi:hypothetical protein